ncbi:FAD-dependent monooxygenase [Shimazuella alba]|uniref:Monooxygenase n=1 Tax=Shimazuella alba TaxID=2690964 RepID=A0A6I4VUP3_9BACL|nr:FAD-dependent monooxygenase [Shimazuella alba]MXQ54241.1 monooxygenase [Shimazuella alba]
MNILISGAGIAGLTLAKRLLMEGYQPTIIEKATTFRSVGSMVELNQDAITVLKKMGLIDEIQKRNVKLAKRQFLDAKGNLLYELSMKTTKGSELERVLIHRFTWHDILYRSVYEHIPIQFGSNIQALSEDETGIQVTFQNGIQQHYDLVIGADGVHSQTRKLLLGNQYEQHEDIGYMVFTIKNPIIKKMPVHLEMGINYATYLPGFYLQFGFDENYAAGLFMYQKDRNIKFSGEQKKTFLLQKCKSIEWGIHQVIEQIDPAYIYEDTMSIINLPEWSKGRTVWVGDAAHAMTFMLGTGGGKAMLGADRLVNALMETTNYKEAFSKYESLHRIDVERLQQKSVEAAKFTISNSLEEFKQKNLLLQHAPDQLLKRYSSE